MSRYEIPAIRPEHKAAVGWDRPMNTFFGIVYDTTKASEESEHGAIIKWVGTEPNHLYEIEDLQGALRKLVRLTPEIMAKLYSDKDEGR